MSACLRKLKLVGAFCALLFCSVTAHAQALPPGWTDGDIGTVGLAGSASYSNGTFTVSSAGTQVWGASDAFHFVYQAMSGDGTLVARIASIQGGTSNASMGVMIRETLDPAAKNANTAEWPSLQTIYLATRSTAGASTTLWAGTLKTPPYWVKIVRTGNTFSGYAALDGVNWTLISTQSVTMASTVYVGLATASGSTTALATTTFDNVSFSPASAPAPAITSLSENMGWVGDQVVITGSGFGATQGGSLVLLNGSSIPVTSWSSTSIAITIPSTAGSGPLAVSVSPSMNNSNPAAFTVLPPGWQQAEIGTVGIPGNASDTNGVLTIQGSGCGVTNCGNNIGSTSDDMHFLYQPLSGDGTIVARVVGTAGGNFVEAGVTIRETLNSNSASAFMESYNGNLYPFYTRTSTGATSSYQQLGQFQGSSLLPYWIKLSRAGNLFSSYISKDGTNWTQVGTSVIIVMVQNVYVGLGVDGESNTKLLSSTFDNVSVSSTVNPAPIITGVSDTTAAVGGSVTISGFNFGAVQGASAVLLHGVPVTVNSWSSTSIVTTIPSGATSGYLAVSVAPTMNGSNIVDFSVTTTPLPLGWLDQDVGAVGIPGGATYANGAFTIAASGNGVGANFSGSGGLDYFHFAYQTLSGDGTIVARVVSTGNVSVQAGVMIRETLSTVSAHAFALEWNTRSNLFYRSATGAISSAPSTSISSLPPYWVKLVRSGSDFTAYASPDTMTWTPINGPVALNIGQNVYVGLGVSSGNTNTLYSATFDNVSISTPANPAPLITGISETTGAVGDQVVITGANFGGSQGSSLVTLNSVPVTINSWTATSITITIPSGATSGYLVVSVAPTLNNSNPITFTVTSQPLPSGWFDLDIGPVGKPGNASYAGGVFTIQGSGAGLAGTADSFHFVYQPLTSDGTIIARVTGEQTTNQEFQASVIIRETLDAFSPEVSSSSVLVGLSHGSGLNFRTVVGGATKVAGGPTATLPCWLKVVRTANVFTAYVSSDGSAWTQIGTPQSFTTAQKVYVGLGATTLASATLGTATFDNVSVNLGGSLPNPIVTGILPATGGPGSSVTISGSGFGALQGSNTVNFDSVSAGVTSWSDTQIVATVPDGATTGPVNVVVGNITGQGPTFTVAFGATVTDSLGNPTTYTSSIFGAQWLFTDASGSGCSSCSTRGTIHNQFDGNGNPAWTTDALGHTVAYKYDTSNNLLAQYVQVDATTIATTSYTYNSFGEVLTVKDPLNNTTTNVYDAKGNLTSVTPPSPGVATHFAYDTKGELTSITDPLSHVTTLTYNAAGLIATITDAQSNVTSYGYDAHGNRTSVTDALLHQTTFAYDAGDHLTTITYPDSTTTTFTYDYRGRRTSVTDQNGKTSTYAYDDADRLTTVTDAANNVTTYAYDTENNLTGITDAKLNTTNFTYDAFGRVTQTNFPSSLIETYAYDANNNLTRKTDRKGQSITYLYDALNRLTQKQYPDGSNVEYAYDLAGKIQNVNDPTGTYAFAYDNMGRLIGTTTSYSFLSSRSFSESYTYDAASNRTHFTDPENGATAYTYDTLNRLSTLTPPAAFTATGNFGFSYDALSRRTQMTRPNSVTTNYTYDNLSRLQSVLHQLAGSTIDGASYTVDNAGNRTAKTDQRAGVTSNYAYDAIYELTGVTQGTNTTESYSYDPVGNRLSSLGVASYTNNVSNELTATPTATYTYDANGNTLTKTDSTGTTTYAWDFENRLTSVALPGTSGTVIFKYDSFGRRIYKSSSAGTSIFAYDGDNLIEETNSSGTAVSRYTGWNIDEPLAMLRSAATSYYHADGLGSVTSLSSSAGSLAETYGYDSFGMQTSSSGSLTNPFQYTAREFDPETNLYFYRARYFDPTTGRFVGEDPIGFYGFDTNTYRYVHNQPGRYIDPFGLLTIDPTFNSDCLSALKRALDIVHRLPKKCDCAFQATGNHRSLNQLMNDKSITVHFDPTADKDEGAHTNPGDTHNVYIAPRTCLLGRWALATALVHELAHINFVPAEGQDDPNGPASTSAYGMTRTCGLWPLSVPGNTSHVSATPNAPIPTEDYKLPDKLTPP
jgi:RHS repeat-associated protein